MVRELVNTCGVLELERVEGIMGRFRLTKSVADREQRWRRASKLVFKG
jgi:hypothetical protein